MNTFKDYFDSRNITDSSRLPYSKHREYLLITIFYVTMKRSKEPFWEQPLYYCVLLHMSLDEYIGIHYIGYTQGPYFYAVPIRQKFPGKLIWICLSKDFRLWIYKSKIKNAKGQMVTPPWAVTPISNPTKVSGTACVNDCSSVGNGFGSSNMVLSETIGRLKNQTNNLARNVL